MDAQAKLDLIGNANSLGLDALRLSQAVRELPNSGNLEYKLHTVADEAMLVVLTLTYSGGHLYNRTDQALHLSNLLEKASEAQQAWAGWLSNSVKSTRTRHADTVDWVGKQLAQWDVWRLDALREVAV